jgi:V/A-type H+-transporting ATPase subunit K
MTSNKNRNLILGVSGAAFSGVLGTFLFWLTPAIATDAEASIQVLPSGAVQWGFVAAALATGLSSLGAGIAVANVGSAAIGAVAEKPELLGRTLIFVGLAEGIAIYGLIISILILNQIV